jgi:putative oxidoreductase
MNNAIELSVGLLVARLVFGLVFAAHGAQKLFGWFGGYGLKGTGGFFEQLGFRPGRLFAALAGGSEFTAGVLIAAGFLTPLAATLTISVMTVATATVHWGKGFFAQGNGFEMPLLYVAASVVLALTGPGAFSLDALLGLQDLWTPTVVAVALVAGLLGAIGAVASRRTAPAVNGTKATAA